MTIDASKLEGWASALQVAKNGLWWYRNEFPETYSTSDDKAHAQLDEALASMAEELEVARGEVMVNGLTEAETSASASVAGLTCGKGCNCADVAAASADDMKVYDGIAAGYHRSTASAIDPKKMRGPCGMATSRHEGRRRITPEFDMPEDAVEVHSALSGMGWSHRSIRQDWPPLGPGQVLDPEIVNQIAAQAGFGPAAAWPEFSGLMQRFFNIAFKMGVQSATSAPGRT